MRLQARAGAQEGRTCGWYCPAASSFHMWMVPVAWSLLPLNSMSFTASSVWMVPYTPRSDCFSEA